MIHQYYCSPCRMTEISGKAIPTGTIPVGTVLRLHREWRSSAYVIERDHIDTVIVEGWLPRVCGAGRYDRHTGYWVDSYHATGMFTAQVRSLANGKRRLLSDHVLLHAERQSDDLPGAAKLKRRFPSC